MMREMMDSDDITLSAGKLMEVKYLDIGTDMAYATVVQSAKFTYKGTPNDDMFVGTYVFKKVAENWTCVHGFRSTGRAPTEDPRGRGRERVVERCVAVRESTRCVIVKNQLIVNYFRRSPLTPHTRRCHAGHEDDAQ
tara:strand:- start:26654 stop:27064 length:411 start_codon:yes stop_codon:yes gene_type:complete